MSQTTQKSPFFPSLSPNFFIQGHRGARGYLPENSIEGFIFCIENNILAIELDLIVLPSGEVLVSHEPYPHSDYVRIATSEYNSIDIEPKNELSYSFFKMKYEEIKKFDGGTKPHPRFPLQKKLQTYKPLLSEVLALCIDLSLKKYKKYPFFNFEIKYESNWRDLGQPKADFAVKKVLEIISNYKLPFHCFCIESFNPQILEEVKRQEKKAALTFLVEGVQGKDQLLKKMQALSFVPDGIAPNYSILNEHIIAYFLEKNINIWTWTVNDFPTSLKLYKQGVQSIITDYPTEMAIFFESQGLGARY
ncbi:glycerophosphodiester phosphodiesterase family protein [Hugenholtzia roseola]|uniref:glycerophosphodiester phosphodiesterase family protein n=1 Tax=Hugenholtzia roseola TaxID=1002 RepID=UPI0004058BAA|nr:glycerophosphodiester phosphodiesterase family protein [Hugenholtzia roseola]